MHRRQRSEILSQLEVQISFLRKSAALYDSGDFEEARRLSSTIHIICYDKGRTVSLLSQLGFKSSIMLPCSRRHIESVFMAGSAILKVPMVVERLGPLLCMKKNDADGIHCANNFEGVENFPRVRFEVWWKDIIWRHPEGELTRESLILSMRDQDGGSHYDGQLNDSGYNRLARLGDDRVTLHNGKPSIWTHGAGPGKPLMNGHHASVRQIAFELDEALKALNL
ncbi:hypothetical protein DFR51_0469 [Sphingosinicella microcystinivorans]|nr:hypothetical protein DFR51_0469 [Sphingosinicella microcystinivorans]